MLVRVSHFKKLVGLMDVQGDAACPLSDNEACVSLLEDVLRRETNSVQMGFFGYSLKCLERFFKSHLNLTPEFRRGQHFLHFRGKAVVDLKTVDQDNPHVLLGVAMLLYNDFPDRIYGVLKSLIPFYKSTAQSGDDYSSGTISFDMDQLETKTINYRIGSLLYLCKEPVAKELLALLARRKESFSRFSPYLSLNDSGTAVVVNVSHGFGWGRALSPDRSVQQSAVVLEDFGNDQRKLYEFLKDLPSLSLKEDAIVFLLKRLMNSPQSQVLMQVIRALGERLCVMNNRDVASLLKMKSRLNSALSDCANWRSDSPKRSVMERIFKAEYYDLELNSDGATSAAKLLMEGDLSRGLASFARDYIRRTLIEDPTVLYPQFSHSESDLYVYSEYDSDSDSYVPWVLIALVTDPGLKYSREQKLDTATPKQVKCLKVALAEADLPLELDCEGLRKVRNTKVQNILRERLIQVLSRVMTQRTYRCCPAEFSSNLTRLISLCYDFGPSSKAFSLCQLLVDTVGRENADKLFLQLYPQDALSRPRTGNYGTMGEQESRDKVVTVSEETCPHVEPLQGDQLACFIADYSHLSRQVDTEGEWKSLSTRPVPRFKRPDSAQSEPTASLKSRKSSRAPETQL